MEIRASRKNDWKEFGAKLYELESIAEYPYGGDFFTLDHGQDYFAFFEKMGEPLFHAALVENRVVKLLKRLPQIPIGDAGQINFYSFS
jgi:hypothetical protein